jgi:aldose 1-epimerase
MDGITYNISANGNNGSMTFNGGEHGWGRSSFDIAAHTKNSITFVVYDRARNGFPGTAASCLTHTVTPYQWKISLGVTPTRMSSPIGLSQQVFWNLDGFTDVSTKTVVGHELNLPFSGLRLETAEDGIPTGDIKGIKLNSTFDFWSSPKSLGTRLGNMPDRGKDGLDDTFLISRQQPWNKDQHPVATLASPSSGVKLELYTDQEAIHLLTWNAPDGSFRTLNTQ